MDLAVQSQPVESQPVESQPVQSQPVESQPVESQRAETPIDAELLEEAQRQIAAPTANAAINEALRRLVGEERVRRDEAGEVAARMLESGEVTFRPLGPVGE